MWPRKRACRQACTALPEGVTVHLACHARAQNMGPKAAEMLKMIPDTPVDVIERCSGHGGTFGVVKPTHDVGVKVGPAGVPRRQHAEARPYRLGLPAGGAAYRGAYRDPGARAGTSHPDHGARLWPDERMRMPETQRKITPDDLLSLSEYESRRKTLKQNLIPVKKQRRVEVGPFATFYFENYATMWLQVQEMLRIEKGGAEQIPGELEAYNPLIPQGDELIATLMLEIEDANRRNTVLLTLGGIEETVFLEIGGETIQATPTEYDDRTTPDGKTSSVHWLRFKLTPEQIARFTQRRRARGAGRLASPLRPHGGAERRDPRGAGEGFRLELHPVPRRCPHNALASAAHNAAVGIQEIERIGDRRRIEALAHQIHLALLEGAGDVDAAATAAGRSAGHRAAAAPSAAPAARPYRNRHPPPAPPCRRGHPCPGTVTP